MKRMYKKVFKMLYHVAFVVICMIGIMQLPKTAQAAVVINKTNFPDAEFSRYLTAFVDKNGDGTLSDEEIADITTFNLSYYDIRSLKGIEHFRSLKVLEYSAEKVKWEGGNPRPYYCPLKTLDISQNIALEKLICPFNELKTLDISQNTALKSLDCYHNELTTLDASQNTELESLNCQYNQLTTLDVSQNTALERLYCSENQLTALDVSQNKALRSLDCSHNQLTTLDVSRNTAFTSLDCSHNQLTALDVSRNTELILFYCSDNKLTTLDISKNPELTELNCSHNQLTTLDVSQNTELTMLACMSNQLTTLDISKNKKLQKDKQFYNNNPWIIHPQDLQASCKHFFLDYDYNDPVSGGAVRIYGNGKTPKENITFVTQSAIQYLKQITLYTDITASYNYKEINRGRVRPITSKVVVGITTSPYKPDIKNGKIVAEREAAKIAKAKIRNGQITVTATGKAGGRVYLWAIDTGYKEAYECCPINVNVLPSKLKVTNSQNKKVSKLKLRPEESSIVYINADPVAVTVSSDEYLSVQQSSSGYGFELKGKGLKDNKATKVTVTFTYELTGKKVKLPVIIQP